MVWDLTELISPEFFFKTEIQPNLYPSLQLVIISIFIYFLLGGGRGNPNPHAATPPPRDPPPGGPGPWVNTEEEEARELEGVQ